MEGRQEAFQIPSPIMSIWFSSTGVNGRRKDFIDGLLTCSVFDLQGLGPWAGLKGCSGCPGHRIPLVSVTLPAISQLCVGSTLDIITEGPQGHFFFPLG